MNSCARIFVTALQLGAACLLPACAATDPRSGIPVIVVAEGSFHGSSSTQIFADGVVITSIFPPGKPAVRTITQKEPEVYARAAAVIASEGIATLGAIKPHPQPCLDYGLDQVTATPTVAGFSQASSTCLDIALTVLMSHVLAALSQR